MSFGVLLVGRGWQLLVGYGVWMAPERDDGRERRRENIDGRVKGEHERDVDVYVEYLEIFTKVNHTTNIAVTFIIDTKINFFNF